MPLMQKAAETRKCAYQRKNKWANITADPKVKAHSCALHPNFLIIEKRKIL